MAKKNITKEDIISDLKEKWDISDIKKEDMEETLPYPIPEKMRRYHEDHYIYLKLAIEQHLSKLSTEKKKAYIQCRKLNYMELVNDKAISTAMQVISSLFFDSGFMTIICGSTLLAILLKENPWVGKIVVFIYGVLIFSQCFVAVNQLQYKFILSILDDIEKKLSEN